METAQEVEQIIKILFEWKEQSMRSIWAGPGGMSSKTRGVECTEYTFHNGQNGHANQCRYRLHEVVLSPSTHQKSILSLPLPLPLPVPPSRSLPPSFSIPAHTQDVCLFILWGLSDTEDKLTLSNAKNASPHTELHRYPLFYFILFTLRVCLGWPSIPQMYSFPASLPRSLE